MRQFIQLTIATLALLLAACSPKQATTTMATAAQQLGDELFSKLEHEYVVYFLNQFPVVATYLGGAAFDTALAEIDGKLRDHSAEGLSKEDVALKEFKRRFSDMDDKQLSARRRIDRSVALAQIEFLLRQHEDRKYQQRALDTYADEPFRGVDWQIQGMTATGEKTTGEKTTGEKTYGTESEWRAVIVRTKAVPAFLANAEKQLAAGANANAPDWRMLMQSGLKSTMADAEYFSKTLSSIAIQDITGENRDALLKDVQDAGNKAADAYRHLREFVAATFFDDVKKTDATALKPAYRADRFSFGEAEYNWALKNNLRLEKTAAQLFDESWPVVEATRKSMVDLASEIAIKHQWNVTSNQDIVRVVFSKLSDDAPQSDDEMVALYRETGVRLVEYARHTGLFEVPTEYKLDVTVTPPPLRSGIDGAAYYPAPPFKKTGVGRFYVTPTDNNLVQLKQEHNRAALADLAAHEGFPGHDWHYKVMAQHAQEISPVRWLTPGAVEDSSSMWEDSMAAEGWALYSEALLGEPQSNAPTGFYTPEERLYQLRGKLYRDLRVRLDTGLHTNRLSFDAAVTLFSEVVDFQPGSCSDAKVLRIAAKAASCKSALGAINRYSRWPTQAITYRLGKEEILALRAQAQQKLGNKFSTQRFHLEFMKQGTIPSGYFADELMNALLK